MEYKSIDDIKFQIENILSHIGEKSRYYSDLKWFTKVRYTTTTEYYGELRIFLQNIMEDSTFAFCKQDLQDICNSINSIFAPKKEN